MNKFNYLPKYWSPWVALVFFTLSFGYAKLPLTSIPLGAFVLAIDWKNFIELYKTNIGKYHFFFCFSFLLYCLLRSTIELESIDLRTLSFILVLFYKSLISLYFANLLVYLMVSNHRLIAGYITIQIILIITSAFDERFFKFLLLFQTPDANAVFGDIFGLRSIGFGIMHNEGVISLLFLYIIYSTFKNNKSKFFDYILGVMLYFSGFSSRLILVMLPVWHALRSFKLLMIITCLATITILNFDVKDGPLGQIFEFFNYYEEHGVIGTGSTNVITSMNFLPEEIKTLIIGDGLFFYGNGFYKDTDIGFSRIIFFGGIFSLFFYLMIFFWPLLLMRHKVFKSGISFVAFAIYVYLGSNIKGIAIHSLPFLFVVIYYSKFNNFKKPIK